MCKRLSREAVRALIEELRPLLPNPRRAHGVSVELQVLIALNFIASGSYQTRVGQNYSSCVSQPTVSKVLCQVVNALNTLMDNWIQFPIEEAEIQHIKKVFWIHTQFPGVIGALDGTHVAIVPPNAEREQIYINRKLYHSLNVLIVSITSCLVWTKVLLYPLFSSSSVVITTIETGITVSDYEGKILSVNAAHGGRTHDARVWRASRVSNHVHEMYVAGRKDAWLLGDSAYPLTPYLITPKLNAPEGTPSARYTQCHIRARSCVERCIGVLKGRWRCLRKDRVLHYTPEIAARIVNAACVLHNIALRWKLPNPDLFYDDIDTELREPNEDSVVESGNQVRERIINTYF